ncbi:hypothetical protein RRG08_042040 [Elysia crispata]|uniref:G-protein coupled receptors family 1 profile domain-containing protein n=1 Tax=Elysia crispata TaxID=231223 RepID=A0AAE1DCB5_9GAST|nr:hypothetical protein RRG08_042040 [Elysia crispata]
MQQDKVYLATTPIAEVNINDSSAITVLNLLTATSNSSGGCPYRDFISNAVLHYSVFCVGIVLVIENSLLIYVIARNMSLHTNTNILVASLAVTDVLMGLQCSLAGLSLKIRSWLAASDFDLHASDKFLLSISLSLVGVSLLHVFSLAVDRYLFVLRPLRYRRFVTRPRVLAVAAAIWILGLIYTLSLLALFQNTHHRQTCIFTEGSVSFGYVPIGCVYLICLVVVTYCTSGMVKLARHYHSRGRVGKRVGSQGSKYRRSKLQKEETVSTVISETGRCGSVPNVEKDANHVFRKIENQKQKRLLPFSIPLNVVIRMTDKDLISFPGHLKNADCDSHNNLPDVEEETTNRSGFASRLVANVGKPEIDFPSLGESIITDDVAEAKDAILLSAEDGKRYVTNKNIYNTNIDQYNRTTTRISNFSSDEKKFYFYKKDVEKSGVFSKSNLKIIKFVLVVFGSGKTGRVGIESVL